MEKSAASASWLTNPLGASVNLARKIVDPIGDSVMNSQYSPVKHLWDGTQYLGRQAFKPLEENRDQANYNAEWLKSYLRDKTPAEVVQIFKRYPELKEVNSPVRRRAIASDVGNLIKKIDKTKLWDSYKNKPKAVARGFEIANPNIKKETINKIVAGKEKVLSDSEKVKGKFREDFRQGKPSNYEFYKDKSGNTMMRTKSSFKKGDGLLQQAKSLYDDFGRTGHYFMNSKQLSAMAKKHNTSADINEIIKIPAAQRGIIERSTNRGLTNSERENSILASIASNTTGGNYKDPTAEGYKRTFKPAAQKQYGENLATGTADDPENFNPAKPKLMGKAKEWLQHGGPKNYSETQPDPGSYFPKSVHKAFSRFSSKAIEQDNRTKLDAINARNAKRAKNERTYREGRRIGEDVGFKPTKSVGNFFAPKPTAMIEPIKTVSNTIKPKEIKPIEANLFKNKVLNDEYGVAQ